MPATDVVEAWVEVYTIYIARASVVHCVHVAVFGDSLARNNRASCTVHSS